MQKGTTIVIGILVVLLVVIGLIALSPKEKQVPITTTPLSTETVLRVGYLPITDHLPLMVAEQGKMFSGVKVEAVKFSDWPTLVEALKAGKIDGAHIINTLAIKAVSQGAPLQAVALSHRGGLALVVKDAITKPEELKSDTVAVPSHFSPHYMSFYHYMDAHGVNIKSDLKVLDMAPPDMIPALAGKSIDGFVVSEPFPALAAAKNVGKTLALWSEMQVPGTNGLDCVIVFRKDMIATHPELVQNYVTSMVKTGVFIEHDRLAAATLASPLMNNIPPQIIAGAIDGTRDRVSYDNLRLLPSEFTIFQNYMVKIGLLDKGIDLSSFLNDRFVTAAYR